MRLTRLCSAAFAGLVFAALLAVWPVGCAPATSDGDDPDRPRRVVATTGMIGDIAEALAGDVIELSVLMGPGIDPHLYKPTRGDVERLERADLILYNGLRLEGRMQDVLSRLARRGRAVLAVAEQLDASALLDDDESDHFDPHVWMDVQRWMQVTDAVRDQLIDLLPEHAEAIRTAAYAYRERLEALDDYARSVVSTIDESARVLVTAHDAFGYFGAAYGLEVHGIQGLSTESEAGLRDIERLIDLLIDRRIPAIFLETSVADRSAEALIERTRARGHEVRVGGRLFSDAMGSPGTYEGTYEGMIDHNVTVIVRALGGHAPPRGMQGRLSDGAAN